MASEIVKAYPDLWIEQRKLITRGEASPSSKDCLFAIYSKRKDKVLRVVFDYDYALWLCDDSRGIKESWLSK